MKKKSKKNVVFAEKKIYRVIQSIRSFTPKEQRLFVKALFSRFTHLQKLQWFKWVCFNVYPEMRWTKVDKWMDAQFTSNMDQVPWKIASMALNYFKINSCMAPFLIIMAQKVKKRVRARKVRLENKCLDED